MRVTVVVGLDNWLWDTWKVRHSHLACFSPELAETIERQIFSLGVMSVLPVVGGHVLGSAVVKSKAVD